MEILTNKYGLSQCWVDAAANDPYEKGDADYSVTGLIKPAQQAQLMDRHEYEVDVTEKVFAILGHAAHAVLERMGGMEKGVIAEQRIFLKVKMPDGNTIVISGAIDRAEPGPNGYAIKDFKITKVWAVTHGAKEDWIRQGNIYRRLLMSQSLKVASIQIEALLKDHSKRDFVIARKKGEDYPATEVHVVNIPIMDDSIIDAYIVERIQLHERAKLLPDHQLPECTEEERWCRDSRYIVTKKDPEKAAQGVQRALPKAGNFNTFSDAEEWRQARKDKDDCEVVFKQGVSKRCEQYCPVSHLCHQYNTKINPRF